MVASPRLTGGPLADWIPFRSRYTVACRPRPRADLFVPERTPRRERATFGTVRNAPTRDKENCKLSTEEVHKPLERKAAEPTISTTSPTRLNNPLSLARFHEAIGLHHPLPEMRNVEVRTAVQPASQPKSPSISPFASPFAKLFESPLSGRRTSHDFFKRPPVKASPKISLKASPKTSPTRRSGAKGRVPVQMYSDFFAESPSKIARKQKPVDCVSPSQFCAKSSSLSDFRAESSKASQRRQKAAQDAWMKKPQEQDSSPMRLKPTKEVADVFAPWDLDPEFETIAPGTKHSKSAEKHHKQDSSVKRSIPTKDEALGFAPRDFEAQLDEPISPNTKLPYHLSPTTLNPSAAFSSLEDQERVLKSKPARQSTLPHDQYHRGRRVDLDAILAGNKRVDEVDPQDSGRKSGKAKLDDWDIWEAESLEAIRGQELAELAARVKEQKTRKREVPVSFLDPTAWDECLAAEESLKDASVGGRMDAESWQERIRANHRELNEFREGERKRESGMGMADLVDSDEEVEGFSEGPESGEEGAKEEDGGEE